PFSGGKLKVDRHLYCSAKAGTGIRFLQARELKSLLSRRRMARCEPVRETYSFPMAGAWISAVRRIPRALERTRLNKNAFSSRFLLSGRSRFRFIGPLETGRFDVAADGCVALVACVLEHLVTVVELPWKSRRPRTRQHFGGFDSHLIF